MASLNGTRCQFRAVFNLLAPSASANQKKERRGLSAGQAPTRATGMLPGSAKKKLFGKLFGGGGVSIWGCVIPYWRLLLWFVMAVGMGLVVWWDSEPGYDPLNPPKADWSVPHSTERQFMVHPLTGEQVEIGDEKNLREIARTHTEVFIPPAVYSGSKDGLVVVPPKQVYEQMMAKEAADEAAAAAAAAALSAEAQRVSLAASQDAHKGKGAFGGGQEGVFEHEQTPPVQDGVQASLATGGSGGNAGGTALEQQGVQHHSQQHEPRASPDLHSASAHNTQASKVMALRAAHAEAQQAHAMAPPSAAATAAAANIQ